jgi:hypothetical protein
MFRPVSFRPVSAIASSSVLALAGLISTAASATEVCDLYVASFNTCARDCYLYVNPVISAECDLTNSVVTQAAISDPPPAPRLKCALDGSHFSCEAWPQSDELSYSWSDEDNVPASFPAASPQRSFACGTGAVSVSIMTSTGATSIASATIPACD